MCSQSKTSFILGQPTIAVQGTEPFSQVHWCCQIRIYHGQGALAGDPHPPSLLPGWPHLLQGLGIALSPGSHSWEVQWGFVLGAALAHAAMGSGVSDVRGDWICATPCAAQHTQLHVPPHVH